MTTVTDVWIDSTELIAVLGISESLFYRQVAAGELPPHTMFGKRKRWRRDDITRWIEKGFPKAMTVGTPKKK